MGKLVKLTIYLLSQKKNVFTGLVQTLGYLDSLPSDRFKIAIPEKKSYIIVEDLAIGDSVAVDGVCLTVEAILKNGFEATASQETLSRTTLGDRSLVAPYVNLETSLRMGSKLGGHFVTGHIDGVGCLIEAIPTEKAWEIIFGVPVGLEQQWDSYIAPYLVSKGSIAVNGISLTVADCGRDWFKVAVIPHTYEETNLSYLKPQDLVNLESDILGKYVDKLIAHRLGQDYTHNSSQDLSLNFLAEHGYM